MSRTYFDNLDIRDENNRLLEESINPSYLSTDSPTSFSSTTTKEHLHVQSYDEEKKKKKKSCVKFIFHFICIIWRFFFPRSIEGKRTGTIISSVLVLLNSCLGGGILAVPYGFYSIGFLSGIGFTIFFGLLGAFTMCIVCYGLIYAEREENKTLTNYQDFIEHYLGYWMKKITEVILALYMAGACISYLAIIGDSFEPVLWYYVDDDSPLFFLTSNRKLIISFFSVLIVYPLTLLRTTKSLDVASFFSNFGVVLLCVIVVFNSVSYLVNSGWNKEDFHSRIFYFNPDLFNGEIPQCFLAIPIIAFAYQCHVIIVPIIAELRNPTILRCFIIIVCAFTTSMSLNVYTGIFGLIQFGDTVNEDILLSYPGNAPLAIFGRCVIGIVATLTYPVIFFNDRLAFTTLIFQTIGSVCGKIRRSVKKRKSDGKTTQDELLNRMRVNHNVNDNDSCVVDPSRESDSGDSEYFTDLFFDRIREPRTGEYVLLLKTFHFIVLSFVLFWATLGLALLVPNIVDAFGFIGSIGSVTLMLTLPSCVLAWFIWNKFCVTCPCCCRCLALILPIFLVALGLVMMTVGVLVTAWQIRASS